MNYFNIYKTAYRFILRITKDNGESYCVRLTRKELQDLQETITKSLNN